MFKDLLDAAIWNFLYQNAFYEDGDRNFNGTVFHLKRGQIVVSIPFLSEGFCTSEKRVRRLLEGLTKDKQIDMQKTNKGSVITICNYDKYQENKNSKDKQKTNKRQTKDHNNNKGSNELINKDIYFDTFWQVYPKQRAGSKQKAFKAFEKALQRDGFENIFKGVTAYSQSEEVKKGFAKGCEAWLNDDRWNSHYKSEKQQSARPQITDISYD